MLLYIIFMVFALIGRALAHDEQEEITHVTKAGRAVVNSLQVTNNAEVEGSLVVEGNVRILGNETIGGNLTVDGELILKSSLAAGAVVVNSTGTVSSVNGTAGQVLTSNGVGVAPSFQAGGGGGGVTSITGDVGGALTGAVTITGGTSGAVFTGSGGNTLTESFNFLTLPNSINPNTGNTGQILIGTGTTTLRISNYNNNIFLTLDGGGGNITTASSNIALGIGSVGQLSTGIENVMIGDSALFVLTTGNENTAVGDSTLNSLTTGSNNTAIGSLAGLNFVTGSNNTSIGASAGSNLTLADSNNIDIGNVGVAGDSGVIRIGTAATHTSAFMSGIAGVTVANNAAVLINTVTGQLGTVVSSVRYKENIQDMASDTDRLLQLRPVIFAMKSDVTKTKCYGLIAEEVAEIFPELVVYKDGQPETVRYHDLPAMLLNELQKQHKKVHEYGAQIQEQNMIITQLQDQLTKVIAELAVIKKTLST